MNGLTLRASGLERRFSDNVVVRDATFEVRAGELTALVGPSGSGKTTLLQMLGLLDKPTSGRVVIGDSDAWSLSSRQRARLRLERIGFVFQQRNLFEHLSVRDNVALPAWRLAGPRRRALRDADALLERFGLSSRRFARARELSVGESQRAAIARALINSPALILADEPTGSLDAASAATVLAALREASAAGTALLLSTHDRDVAAIATRRLRMHEGQPVAS